jgi:hypothetical protein
VELFFNCFGRLLDIHFILFLFCNLFLLLRQVQLFLSDFLGHFCLKFKSSFVDKTLHKSLIVGLPKLMSTGALIWLRHKHFGISKLRPQLFFQPRSRGAPLFFVFDTGLRVIIILISEIIYRVKNIKIIFGFIKKLDGFSSEDFLGGEVLINRLITID